MPLYPAGSGVILSTGGRMAVAPRTIRSPAGTEGMEGNMAPRKPTVRAPVRRSPAKAAAPRRTGGKAPPNDGLQANRLLREAAWARMFGRVESKNPFAR